MVGRGEGGEQPPWPSGAEHASPSRPAPPSSSPGVRGAGPSVCDFRVNLSTLIKY